MPPRKNKPPPWRSSKAKAILRSEIIAGNVTENMDPVSAYIMRDEYQVYPFDNFKTNLKNLLVKVKNDKKAAANDAATLAHDRTFYPIQPDHISGNHGAYPRWQGSEAERALKEAMDEGLHLEMKPEILQQHLQLEEPEVGLFPLKVFRDHIHQEKRRRTEGAYWQKYWESKKK